MFTQAQELLNVMSLMRTILNDFLLALARGVTIEDYITNSGHIARLTAELDSLRNQNGQLDQRAVDLQTQLEASEDQIAELRNQQVPLVNSQIAQLLTEALSLLTLESPETEESVREEEFTGTFRGTFPNRFFTETTMAGTQQTNEETLEMQEDTVEDDIDDELLDEDDDIDDELLDEDDDSDQDFDLDDEDLEVEAARPTTGSAQIVKHPDITEDFQSVENSHMVMFIFVRYSHLPYHYTLNGSRYKLVLNGTQVISTTV